VEDDVVCAAVAAGTGSSWVLVNWPWMRSLWEGYEPGNALDILVKDIRAVLEEAEAERVELPVTALAFARLLETWNLPR
jgi:3-hydroxyisobutyrate dehydrogenase-like beta-hydroxyacid dehydrogenase